MKRQTIFMMLLLVGFCMPVVAQTNKQEVEQRVQLARERYAKGLDNIALNKQYERDGIPAVNYTTIVRQQNWPGSGMMNDKMEFYYDEIEDDMEPYPIGYHLLIIRRNYNIGGFQAMEEYVYDEESDPLFWFTRFDNYGEIFELRGYFGKDGSLLRTICKKKDDSGKMTTCDLNDSLEARFSMAQVNVNHFKSVFMSLYDVYYAY